MTLCAILEHSRHLTTSPPTSWRQHPCDAALDAPKLHHEHPVMRLGRIGSTRLYAELVIHARCTPVVHERLQVQDWMACTPTLPACV